MKDKRSTAYHEAGHAVLKAYFRLKIDRVSIISDADSLGHTKGPPATKSLTEAMDYATDYKKSGKAQLAIERDVKVLLAGMAAQKEFMPRSARSHHGQSDYQKAIELLATWTPPEGVKPYFKLMEIKARQLVRCPALREQIEAVAKELLRCKEMNGKQVEEVIWDAMGLRSFSRRLRSRVS